MPINYEVEAAGRAGAELRVARRDMRLICTGPAARLGLLLPHLTTTTTRSPSTGQPVTVRVHPRSGVKKDEEFVDFLLEGVRFSD